jgi:4-amino-4-deoxy-L-arabinose transferase-like glycosyltransferase
MNSFNVNPHSLNQRISRNIFYLIAGATACIWLYSLFFVPTFDLDESLYRRAAEEIKRTGEWWKPTWDHLPLYHKPPIFYWMIALISSVVDGVQAPVSIFAARLPSFLASIGILYSLFRFTRNYFAPALFLSAIFPFMTATGVIFDPIQTLMLMPTLILPTRAFLEKRSLVFEEYLYIGLGMFLASAFKGLNGIVLPTLAFGLHWLLFIRETKIKVWFSTLFRFSLLSFLPAAVLTALYYSVLDSTMGRPFTLEFFLVHHLGRSQGAMESHGGSIFYHPMILFFGSGFLTTFLFYQWMRIRPAFKQYCYPLTYTFTFIFVFSFSATKLPHYLWPVWPALALMGAILFQLSDRQSERDINRMAGFLVSLPVFTLGAVAILVVFTPAYLLNQLQLTEQLKMIITQFAEISIFSRLSLVAAAIACIAFQAQRSYLTRHPMLTAGFAVGVSMALGFGMIPSVTKLLVTPFEEIAESVRYQQVLPTDCLRYAGPHSPTLSLALGYELIHNRCEPYYMKYLIAPKWKEHECEERHMKVLDRKSYLILCGKE